MTNTSPELGQRPRVVGRYALFDEIAAGGMATVHLGRLVGQVGFSRTVAVKRLHPQYAKDQDFVSMFVDEARLASRIQHPNVVSTLDVVKTDDELFLVMEYVPGEALSRLVRNAAKRGERIPPKVVLSVMSGMLHGLHAAHDAKSETREPLNIVHRDISPQNVLVGVDGVARVLDFGVAKAAMRSGATHDGQMKGKLSYMSPEQINGREIDRRSDIFAAGIVLWEALAGKRLFAGADPGEIVGKVLASEIPSPRSVVPELSIEVADAVMKSLERDPEKRFQTARAFAIALEQAAPVASPHLVGEWVKEYGGDELVKRANTVARVEGHPMDQLSLAASPSESSQEDETSQNERTSGVAPPVDADVALQPPLRRPRAIVTLSLLILGSGAGILLGRNLFRPEPNEASVANQAVMEGTSSGQQKTAATPLPSVVEVAPPLASSKSESSGEAASPEPSAVADPASSAVATKEQEEPRRVRPVVISPRPQIKPRPAPKKDCDPPYTVDPATGVRKPKLHCLK